jgi:hypothetical protein
MAQTCTKCSRPNPAEAVFCFFDGSVLDGHGRHGPVAVGSQPFQTSFVFPTGRTCRCFDELAIACQEDWVAARELLHKGYLETFLAGLGRKDLSQAAREAARFPDPDRGLDQLLTILPSDVLAEPRLYAEPLLVNLGVLTPRSERAFDLHLENQGMRLLYGSVTCEDNVWLSLGDTPGAAEKHFQFTHELILPIRVRADHLRAGPKPYEARLFVESNGGTATVVVHAEVPVTPFPPGILGGARSPRQVAEKAKANPNGAAALFESGAVAQWYKSNGWTYPVQGPSASGLGAVQQFFEALGLTPAPKVDISERKITLRGNPGDPLRHSFDVSSEEKKPVYAHGMSNQPWLEVGRPKLNGRVATIHLNIPSVPNRPGETLSAKLLVRANGNQRFIVPVTLEVGSTLNFDEPVPPPVEAAQNVPNFATLTAPSPAPPPVKAPPRRTGTPTWLHLLPAALLALALLAVLVTDVIWPLRDNGQGGASKDDDSLADQLYDRDPRLGVEFDPEMRFGIQMLQERDPTENDKHKRLTYHTNGQSNNTCVLIDGDDFLFGKKPGEWERSAKMVKLKEHTYRSVQIFPQAKIRVTQHIEIKPGDQSRVLDTCLIWYTVENASTVRHKVGLRVMIDTFIGANDGVPFVIPGQEGLMDTKKEFSEKEVPDYIEALEKPDLKSPGTVAHMGLKGLSLLGLDKTPIDLEPIESMLICHWPSSTVRWKLEEKDVLPIANEDSKDSCVFLYWPYRAMAPGEKREMAFTYGLGKIAVEGSSNLGLTAGGAFRPGGVFTVTAYVKDPQEGQTVKLDLPRGLSFAGNETAEKAVAKGGQYNQTSWRVKAASVGAYTLRATSGADRASYTVRIQNKGIFE